MLIKTEYIVVATLCFIREWPLFTRGWGGGGHKTLEVLLWWPGGGGGGVIKVLTCHVHE